MEINKKLISFSAAALLALGTVALTSVKADAATTTKQVMHTALAYDKNGKKTGVKYYSYRWLNFESKVKTIDGSKYYKVSGKNQYIKVGNIDGTKRELSHNSYVYATSNRRANRQVLKKGDTITTYGSSYKFKNGKRYYRIGGPSKQYVKVVNFGDIVSNNTSANTDTDNSTVDTNVSSGTIVTKSAKIYDKNGKPVTTVPSSIANYVSGSQYNGYFIRWRSRIPFTGTKTINGELYYSVADDVYVKSSDIREIVGQVRLHLAKNAKIYNKNGQIISTKLPTDRYILYTGKVNNITKATKYYYINNEGQPQEIPYTTINGEDYYDLGNGQYVKIVDVTSVNGNSIQSGYITVTTTKAAPLYTMKGKKTSETISKGKKVQVEEEIVNPQNVEDIDDTGWTYYFYKIKGENKLINFGDVNITNSPIKPFYFDENSPADLRISFPQDTATYNAQGQRINDGWFIPSTNGGSYSVDKLVYIYDSATKKAELFYHMVSKHLTLTNPAQNLNSVGEKNMELNDIYVKASDTNYYSGRALTPANTAEEAEAKAITNK